MRQRELAVLAWAAALLAVALGSWGISEASLWLDETFTVHDARRSLADIVTMQNEAYGGAHHPGGYFLVVKAAMAICGAHETCVRLPSVLANAALAAVIVILAARLFGRTAAIAAAIVWPALPYALKYAQQARHYSLLGLVTALALLLAVRALAKDGGAQAERRTFVLLGLTAGLALWVHLFAVPFLVGLALFCMGWQLKERAVSWQHWAIAIAVALFVAAPLLPGMWKVWATSGGGQLESRAGPIENAAELTRDLLTFGLDSWWVPGIAAFALVPGPWSRRALVLGLFLVAVFPLSGVLLRNPQHFVALRYFMPSLAAIAVLQAAGVAAIVSLARMLAQRVRPQHERLLGAVIAVLILAWPTLVLARLHVAGIAKQYDTADFEPWDRIAESIHTHALDGDLTVVVPYVFVRFPFEVYELPTEILDPEADDFAARLRDHQGTIFVVTSHIDRPERVAQRGRTMRTLTRAGFVRRPLPGVAREANIELLAYQRI
ncbi:MAG TPA: glycosyltransferase family 39 protein [Nannocystaceae bacterium]|nr:glycosyltransferase family 39 protein [Nannocystaceae bacterium]